jgi:uncharacterized protein involved in cysteine biosynthesis
MNTTILQKALRDILSRDVLPFILTVGIGSILVWVLPLWWIWDGIVGGVEWAAQLLPWTEGWKADEGTTSFWTALKVGYIFVIITISIATALWGEEILRKLVRKRYPHIHADGSAKIHRTLYYNFKANALFLLLLIVLLPILFIPYLGTLVLLYLWSVQLKEPTVYDVGAVIGLNKKEIKHYAKKSRWIALSAAALNFIPLVNFFVPLFAQIMFLHFVIGKRESSKGDQTF